jgi:nucleotidyltransferase/DNA polymerase involved in DNA repair
MQNSDDSKHQLKIQDVITLTARLAQLLAEEADLLGHMKIKEIEKLQNEKIFLTNAIDAQRKMIEKSPHMVETIPSKDRHDMEALIEVFNNILAENHRKLLLAKEVNHKIVGAIKEVVKEHTVSKNYSGDGVSHYTPFETMSITLDKVI